MFRALGNPNRLAIYARLLSCCGMRQSRLSRTGIAQCVGEVGKDLGIAPSTVSHHIRELSRAGLIELSRRGQFVECCLSEEAFNELSAFFGQETLCSPAR